MTLVEKREAYRKWLNPVTLTRKEQMKEVRLERQLQSILFHLTACGLVAVTILLLWVVGSK